MYRRRCLLRQRSRVGIDGPAFRHHHSANRVAFLTNVPRFTGLAHSLVYCVISPFLYRMKRECASYIWFFPSYLVATMRKTGADRPFCPRRRNNFRIDTCLLQINAEIITENNAQGTRKAIESELHEEIPICLSAITMRDMADPFG